MSALHKTRNSDQELRVYKYPYYIQLDRLLAIWYTKSAIFIVDFLWDTMIIVLPLDSFSKDFRTMLSFNNTVYPICFFELLSKLINLLLITGEPLTSSFLFHIFLYHMPYSNDWMM